jgi:uncharacterized repeat protein (TIGR03843 family)
MVINTDILHILQHGKLKIKGEFLWGSNYTFFVAVENGDGSIKAVYKPTRGERPLWDFPVASLAKREAAAYLVSQELGWELVPPTVYRKQGPIGVGSLQVFIEHDPEYHYFNFSEEDRQRLRPTVLFDLIINNADRKGSHILFDPERHIWLIDHGICFHVENKLRTVIWDFVGEQIPAELIDDLSVFEQKLVSPLDPGHLPDDEVDYESDKIFYSSLRLYLQRKEIASMKQRIRKLIKDPRFPGPDPNHRPVPWPAI